MPVREYGGWRISSTKDELGRVIDDTEILMKRPDGQPCNVQNMYVGYYEAKGYVRADPLDFDDVIVMPLPKKLSRDKMRADKYLGEASKMSVKKLMKALDKDGVEYFEDAKKEDLISLWIGEQERQRKERMKSDVHL